MKKLAELPQLTPNATKEDVRGVLDLSRKIMAKRLAKMLGKKDAKLFSEDENEAYILDVADTDLSRVIACYNLIIQYANVVRNIANLGVDALNKIIGLVLPFIFKRIAELKAHGMNDNEAYEVAYQELDIDLNEEESNV